MFLLSHILLSQGAYYNYTAFTSLNCSASADDTLVNTGARNIDKVHIEGLTAVECRTRCQVDYSCSCVIWTNNTSSKNFTGSCGKRANCVPADCKPDASTITFVKDYEAVAGKSASFGNGAFNHEY